VLAAFCLSAPLIYGLEEALLFYSPYRLYQPVFTNLFRWLYVVPVFSILRFLRSSQPRFFFYLLLRRPPCSTPGAGSRFLAFPIGRTEVPSPMLFSDFSLEIGAKRVAASQSYPI